ncbi:MAG TPA: twin-arginine translocase subunit TatC [Planctomycetota bacterium]|jgi:Tat protein translocase TatC|nr:twin-arginine translocase subunit TatC [Planctomycetota bacterium]
MVDLQLQDRMDQAGKKGEESEARMTFGEHIEELRGRLLKSIIFLLLATVLSLFFYNELVTFITQPHLAAMRSLRVDLEKKGIKTNELEYKLMAGGYTAPVLATMKLGFIIALFVSSPFIGYQIWAFISAGLYKHERKYVVLFAPISYALFALGCAFGYFFLVRICLEGLAKTGLGKGDVVSPQYMFTDYLNLVTTLTILLGAVFQLPLIMVFLSKIGLVAPPTYNKFQRLAILCNLIAAAFISPPDVISMCVVAIPMILLYEIGVAAAFIFAPSKPAETAKT